MIENISISEIVAQTKHLEIRARKMVSSSLQSDYKSSFKGQGMEFDEVRAYVPGDNIRDIDWNVTARMNEPFIKVFTEERELQVYFVADISASENFGGVKSKRHIMAEITALLGFTSFFANDKTGLILGTDQIEKIIPPAHNYSHVLRIIRDVFYYQGESSQTNLNNVFRKVNQLIKKKAIIFILSDFLDTDYEHSLGTLAKKHEIIPLVLKDPLEKKFTTNSFLPTLVEFEDMESGERSVRYLNKESVTDDEYTNSQHQRIFKRLGLEYAEVSESTDYLKTIDKILRRHTARQ